MANFHSADIPLAKASHMVQPNIGGQEIYFVHSRGMFCKLTWQKAQIYTSNSRKEGRIRSNDLIYHIKEIGSFKEGVINRGSYYKDV